MPVVRPAALPFAFTVGIAACVTGPARLAPLAPLPAVGADTVRSRFVAIGVRHEYRYHTRGPWAIHLLDIDRAAGCWTLVAEKGNPTTTGRQPTSELIGEVARVRGRQNVAGGTNADFFLFDPPGVPQGAHVQDGRVLAGPVPGRPVVVVDDTGRVSIATLSLSAEVLGPMDRWNHPARDGVALLDERYGAPTDTAAGTIVLIASLVRTAGDTLRAVVTTVDSGGPRWATRGTIVLVAGPRAPLERRTALTARHPGDTVQVIRQILPRLPREAVGGFPVLVAASAVDPGIDTAGSEGFRGRHPRTALLIADGARRIILLTVDGRQPGYSAGMTLRELADYALALGAHDAVNLDGGGSTTMVVRDSGEAAFRVVNRPSDKEGERPVANALAVVQYPCAVKRGP